MFEKFWVTLTEGFYVFVYLYIYRYFLVHIK